MARSTGWRTSTASPALTAAVRLLARIAGRTSKAGLIGMTKSLAREYAPFNILINNIAPDIPFRDVMLGTLPFVGIMIIAVALMVVGIATVGAITASVATWMIAQVERERGDDHA